MAKNHRIFIGFAIEDKFARDNLVFQAKKEHTPFEFIDMSVKQPWDSAWKTNCRALIQGCDGMIAFLSKNTRNADGARWEIKCAIDEEIPLLPLYIHDEGCTPPPELSGRRIYHWTWPNVVRFLESL
jgi:hypothetical protein